MQHSCAHSITHLRESWKAAIVNPGTLSSSRLSMYFSTMSVCMHDERGSVVSVVCVCVHAHCVGRGRTHIASENVHVHVLVLLAVLEVVAMFSEKCLVQMAELVLCTHNTKQHDKQCVSWTGLLRGRVYVPSTMPWSASTVRSKAASSSLLPPPLAELDSRVSSAQPFTSSAP